MEWTRGLGVRLVALVFSSALVVIHRDDRAPWFWVGVALTVVNGIGLLAALRSRRPPAPPVPVVRPPRPPAREVDEVLLADLWLDRQVAEAVAGAPAAWRQVTHLDQPFEPASFRELADAIWVEVGEEEASIAVGDELKPYLDLDVDESADAAIGVLLGHPDVEAAWHEDREVYRVELSGAIGREEFAALAVRALTAHHLDATSRLST